MVNKYILGTSKGDIEKEPFSVLMFVLVLLQYQKCHQHGLLEKVSETTTMSSSTMRMPAAILVL